MGHFESLFYKVFRVSFNYRRERFSFIRVITVRSLYTFEGYSKLSDITSKGQRPYV